MAAPRIQEAAFTRPRGHANKCDCPRCAQNRVNLVIDQWRQYGSVSLPEDGDQTVFVRAYWRRQINHLTKAPQTKRLLLRALRAIKKSRAGTWRPR